MIRSGVFSVFLLLNWGLIAGIGSGGDLEPKRLADSLYSTLSENEKANHWVWLEFDRQVVNSPSDFDNLLGGVIISNLTDLSYMPRVTSRVLRLAPDFSNLTSEFEVPYLKTLLATPDPEIREKWYRLIRSSGIKGGFDHLILPELSTGEKYLGGILEEMYRFDSNYFYLPYDLVYATESRRKSFYENLNEGQPTIIRYSEWNNYEKTLLKGPRRFEIDREVITKHLSQSFYFPEIQDNLRANQVNRLFKETLKSSIIPLQKKENFLPLNADTIAIWTTSQIVEQQLKVYFNTVLNVAYDQVPDHIPLVIDARTNPMQALEVALNHSRSEGLIWIGNTETLMDLNPAALLLIAQDNDLLDVVIPEMLYGSEPIIGALNQPIPDFLANYHFDAVKQYELLGYARPEWVGMNQVNLDSIDFLAKEMISEYATPGAQLMVVKEGKIVLDKNYGFLTYDSIIPVSKHTVFDLASLTKVTATLLAVMKLDQEGKIHLDSTIGYYLPEFQNTNKSTITLRQLLSHQGGLKSYLPFWKRSMKGDFMDVFYYKSDDDYANDKRSYGYQPDPVMLDSLVGWIKHSPLITTDSTPPYRYSDIGFMVLHQIVESVSNEPMDAFLETHFYKPLGMESTCFNPMSRGFELFEIAPTEYDYYFRDEQVWGQVHDRNAVVFGGVAGHAGLFSNAKDLALLLQMILQEGNYRNQQFIDNRYLADYNQQYFDGNRRGLGWDKPGVFNPNISSLASPNSFGHTGFTGTMVWVDPDDELIFIFLSNRIFPDSNNKKLIQLDTRKRMHELVYQSLSMR